MKPEVKGYSHEMYPIEEYAPTFAWIPVKIKQPGASGFAMGVECNYTATKKPRPYLWVSFGETVWQSGGYFRKVER